MDLFSREKRVTRTDPEQKKKFNENRNVQIRESLCLCVLSSVYGSEQLTLNASH